MSISLRLRTHLALLPLLALMALLGIAAVFLLHRLGGRIDDILRENYDSVRYMERLKEALERIDSTYTFALTGQEQKAREQYESQWEIYNKYLDLEQQNITVAGEKKLAEKLVVLSKQYRSQGDAFYSRATDDRSRHEDYFGADGLLAIFKDIKDTADEILHLNQDYMERASRDAHGVFRESIVGLIAGLALAAVVGVFFAWRAVETTLQPIRAVIRSAQGIGSGNFDQVLPIPSHDELGDLAKEFNAMARQLRQYRQSDYARLLRAQRTSQATIDSFPDPVFVVDPGGKVEMANPAAQRLFGFPEKAAEAAAHPWLPPDSLQMPLKEALQNQSPYMPQEFDHAILFHVGGKDQSFLPHVLPIRDPLGHTLGAAVLLQDVTRFRLLDQIKSDLVATASHELKTPLTSIRLAHYLLLEETVGPLTPKQTELLLDARDNSERLLAVVNNLLDLTRLEHGREYLDLKPIATVELLKSAVDRIEHRALDKGVSMALDVPSDPGFVAVDASRLDYALSNLLDNALTYTERGGKITVSAAPANDQIELIVTDTGAGIPPEHLPHIFDRFSRIPNQSRGPGTGLGLAIVREIVTAHGGTVTCESQLKKGTTFRIRLPHWNQTLAARDAENKKTGH